MINNTLSAVFDTVPSPSPILWIATILSIALIPVGLNMTLDCRFISCLKRTDSAELSDLFLYYAKGDGYFPILSISLWKEAWKQQWSFRSWIGILASLHNFFIAVLFLLGSGTINYAQKSLPFYFIVGFGATYSQSILQHAVLMYYSTLKVYYLLAPTTGYQTEARKLYISYLRARRNVFCAQVLLQVIFLSISFGIQLQMSHILCTEVISILIPLIISFVLEFWRFKKLYNTLVVVRPQPVTSLGRDESGRPSITTVAGGAGHRKNAKRIVRTTLVSSGIFIVTLSCTLAAFASTYMDMTGMLNTQTLLFWHSGTFLFCVNLVYRAYGTRKKLNHERWLFRKRQLPVEITTLTIDSGASRLFG